MCLQSSEKKWRGRYYTLLRNFCDDANEKKATWSLLCGPDKETRSQALNSRKMPRQCHEEWLGRWRAHRACSKTRPVREEVSASLSSR